MYDHDPAEVELLGWEEFIARQWESIFTGYRSWTGLRRMGRRWSDLIEAGLGCSPETADLLVAAEILGRADDDLEAAASASALVEGMTAVLARLPAGLAGLAEDGEITPEQAATLTGRHARLMTCIRASRHVPEGSGRH